MKYVECSICGSFLKEEGFFCSSCHEEILLSLRLEKEEAKDYYIYRLFYYHEKVKKMIHQMKYEDKPYLSRIFAYFLSEGIEQTGLEVDLISYIPMHFYKRWVRGYDQAKDLGFFTAKYLEVPFHTILKRNRWTKSLYSLKKQERKEELQHVFTAKYFTGNLLVVDDLMTTGATISEAAKALRKSGENFSFLTLV